MYEQMNFVVVDAFEHLLRQATVYMNANVLYMYWYYLVIRDSDDDLMMEMIVQLNWKKQMHENKINFIIWINYFFYAKHLV